MNSDLNNPPDDRFGLLVIGAGRSGTSLLAAMLDQHPDIEMGMELFADDCLRGKALQEDRDRLFWQRAESFLDACRKEAQRTPAKLWGNKITTEQFWGLKKHNLYNRDQLDICQEFFGKLFEGRRVINILRDGRACIQSKMKRVNAPLERACEQWRLAVQVHQYLLNRPLAYSLRFEDLVADPVGEIKGVLEFLEMDYHDEVLLGTSSEKMMRDYRRSGFDSSRANDVPVDHPCVSLVAEELRLCGYV